MFNKNCASGKQKYGFSCSKSTMDDMAKTEMRRNLTNTVRRCFYDSGGLDGPQNSLFDKEINAFDQYTIEWTPVVTINSEKYRGNLACLDPLDTTTCSVFAAICAAFAQETIPLACAEHSHKSCPQDQVPDVCGVCGGDGFSCKKHRYRAVNISLFFIAGVVLCQLVWLVYCRRRVKRTQKLIDRFKKRYLHDEDFKLDSENINLLTHEINDFKLHSENINLLTRDSL